ncbi:MAG: NTP transferase domain-containing protein [Granulosicoccus sp.]|nr:NTP transferase domain-containing protein [Granulosicoccus sp.]
MIKKAVIPVAGLGTRLAPATSAIPKTMFPLLDKPVLHYVIDEARKSGISEIALVVGSNRSVIEQYLAAQQEAFSDLSLSLIVQEKLNGLGAAILCAQDFIGQDSFAVLLGDSITLSSTPVIGQLVSVHLKTAGAVIGVEEVDVSRVDRYGIAGGEKQSGDLMKITELVEKPSIEFAPSNWAIAGRYILPSDTLEALAKVPPGINNEIQLTDAIAALLPDIDCYACRYSGDRFDIGNAVDYLQACIKIGLQRPDTAQAVRQLLSRCEKSAD